MKRYKKRNGRIYPSFKGRVKDMMREVPEAFLYFYDSWETWHEGLRHNKDNSMIRRVNKHSCKAEEVERMNKKPKLLAQRRKLCAHLIA
ncbi:MAG: hypothetical protein V1734_01530 [Nanoarchaeota archaeon]